MIELARPGGTMRLRRVTAPNPSAMTGTGTNSYILGEGRVAVIDPGPRDETHLAALLAALGPQERVAAILVTHAHRDHSALARDLARVMGAPVLALPAPPPETPPFDLAPFGPGGEGIDSTFAPDQPLHDGQVVEGGDWAVRVLHTPGHLGDHVCLAAGDALFTGDHVMGWSTSLVSPPEGDMRAYRASLRRLASGRWSVMHPGHGPPVIAPDQRTEALIAHRTAREAAILAALADSPATLHALTGRVYLDTPAALIPAASRNVLAHLVELACETRIVLSPGASAEPTFALS